MSQFHETFDSLDEKTKDMSRAIHSLLEEFEAIDLYEQRINRSESGKLKEILAHNRDEEKEHALLLLAWIKSQDPILAKKFQEMVENKLDVKM
jgi:hypothetical protein